MALAGQGLRDVTRIAASDPMLWTQILAGNAPALRVVLEQLAADLDDVLQAVRQLDDARRAARRGAGRGSRAVLARAVGQRQRRPRAASRASTVPRPRRTRR